MPTFSPGYGGIGADYPTFKSDLTVGLDEDSVVSISADMTVDIPVDDSSFFGVVKVIDPEDKIATVQVAGFAVVAYSGDPPTAGIERLASDGTGGVKIGVGVGFFYQVVNVDTVNSLVTFLLSPVPEVTDPSSDLIDAGVGSLLANFRSSLTPGTDEGKVVRQSTSTDRTVILVPNSSSVIDGVVKSIDPDTFMASVQIAGVVTVPYTSTAPSLGGEQLESNGIGGVKKGTGGGYIYLVIDIDGTNNLITFFLEPKQFDVG